LWVVAILASLAVLIILVLCVPVEVTLNMDVYGRPKFRLRLVWLFGLVSKELSKGKRKPEEKRRVIEGKPKLSARRARAMFDLLRTRGLLSQLKQLLRNVLRRVKIRELGADFRVGFDNPADTGLLFALIGPATLFLSPSVLHGIRVQPSFEAEAILEGHLYGTVRARPIQLVTPFLRFAFSLATIRAVKILVLTKWKRRK